MSLWGKWRGDPDLGAEVIAWIVSMVGVSRGNGEHAALAFYDRRDEG